MSDLIKFERRIAYLENKFNTTNLVFQNDAPNKDKHEYEKKIKSLEEELVLAKQKIEALEKSFSNILDRVMSLKEKSEPAFDITQLESRIISLEEVTGSLVGVGRS